MFISRNDYIVGLDSANLFIKTDELKLDLQMMIFLCDDFPDCFMFVSRNDYIVGLDSANLFIKTDELKLDLQMMIFLIVICLFRFKIYICFGINPYLHMFIGQKKGQSF